MDIARRNAGKNGIDEILSGTNDNTGDGLGRFWLKKRANMAESTDRKVGWRADVGNILIKIETFVKSDTKYLDVVYQWNWCLMQILKIVYELLYCKYNCRPTPKMLCLPYRKASHVVIGLPWQWIYQIAPVSMASGWLWSHIGSDRPSNMEKPNMKMFLDEFMLTSCKLETPTAATIPVREKDK